MLQSSTPSTAMPPIPDTIQSRFGEISVDANKALVFPHGLLGLPDKVHFALAAFPSEKMKQFMLLQSLDETKLSFIALPTAIDNAFISPQDIREVCRELDIAETSLGILFIVSVHRNLAEVKLSVNARAPILIDSVRRIGIQHVFQNDQYKVQHML